MDSSYQVQETHCGNLSLSVHDRINDLHRRADRLARAWRSRPWTPDAPT